MLIRTSVGIEIAGKDLRIAAVRSTMGKLRLLQVGEISGFADLSQEERKSRLAQIVKKHKLPPSRVFLSLPRDQGIVRQLEFPVQVGERLRSAVALQLETLSPWPVDDIYWDFAQEKTKKGATTIVVTVVVIPRATLNPWIEFFKAVKLPLSGACLSAPSCAHGVRALWTDPNPTVILDCESAYVEGSLVHGSRLVSVSQMVADEVDSADRLTNAAKTVLERLVALGRVTSLDNARMVAYGSAASSLESLDVVALPLENAGPESSGAFGAIASALLPVKKTGFEANLVPRRLRYRRNQLQLVPTYILIFLTVVLGILMLIREPYQLMVYAFKLDLDVQKITPDIADVARQEAELNRISEKYRALTGHIRGRDANLEALRDLARVLADAVWLTNYTYQDGALTVTGFAPSATEVQRVLEDSPLFREVTFTSSVTKDATGKDRFTLKAAIEVTR